MKQILTDVDFNNASRIKNLPDGLSSQEPATVAQLASAIAGVAWKDNCRVSTATNINLNNPGTALDGITMALNDRVCVRGQNTASQNGIYIWNGSAVAMTRSTDADTAAELESAVTTIDAGTSAGSSFRQSTVGFTLGTGSVVWVNFGAATAQATEALAGKAEIATQAETDAGTDDQRIVTPLKLATWANAKKKLAVDIGNASATLFTVTHNFNTRDVQVQVRRNSGNFDIVDAEVRINNVNSVDVVFSAAPSNSQFRVIVLG